MGIIGIVCIIGCILVGLAWIALNINWKYLPFYFSEEGKKERRNTRKEREQEKQEELEWNLQRTKNAEERSTTLATKYLGREVLFYCSMEGGSLWDNEGNLLDDFTCKGPDWCMLHFYFLDNDQYTGCSGKYFIDTYGTAYPVKIEKIDVDPVFGDVRVVLSVNSTPIEFTIREVKLRSAIAEHPVLPSVVLVGEPLMPSLGSKDIKVFFLSSCCITLYERALVVGEKVSITFRLSHGDNQRYRILAQAQPISSPSL
ncbi:MAG: hypothetical protein LBO09_08625 [Candidatus Peribacteria bacterium]|jgi:hypothetical protein|nr:hypothetical protein [Candidatus Peribacteria bacterium]